MAIGYDIGASFASSSGAQTGDITAGDIVVGGSGGASKTPSWIWLVAGGIAVFLFLAWLVKK